MLEGHPWALVYLCPRQVVLYGKDLAVLNHAPSFIIFNTNTGFLGVFRKPDQRPIVAETAAILSGKERASWIGHQCILLFGVQ
jgi:hypothetical protein